LKSITTELAGAERVGLAPLFLICPRTIAGSQFIHSFKNVVNPSDLSSSRAVPTELPRGAPSWVTIELLEKTRQVWGKKAGIPISSEDALGIILRVGTLLDVLSRR
jgi:hypothetical protein